MATFRRRSSLTISESEIISKLKGYINTRYYVGLCPTKIVKKTSGCGTYHIYQRWLPQVLFSLVQVLYCLGLCYANYIRAGSTLTAASNFSLFTMIFAMIQVVAIQYSFWAHSHDFVIVVNFVSQSSKTMLPPPGYQPVYLVKVLIVCFVTCYISISIIAVILKIYHVGNRNCCVVWQNMIQEGSSLVLFRGCSILRSSNFSNLEILSGAVAIAYHSYL